MRAMWRVHGKPGGAARATSIGPTPSADAEARLAEVSGDAGLRARLLRRYIQGREVADYPALLARAGFVVRPRNPGRAWWGDPESSRATAGCPLRARRRESPAYAAGLDRDDEITSLGWSREHDRIADHLSAALQRHRPGDTLPIVFMDRSGAARPGRSTFAEDPAHRSRARSNTPAPPQRRRNKPFAAGGWHRIRLGQSTWHFPGFGSLIRLLA